MKLIEPEQHIHKYEKQAIRTVLLYDYRPIEGQKPLQPGTAGKDIIKLLLCACGATLAYDLERTVA
jgi:hypothetical protein